MSKEEKGRSGFLLYFEDRELLEDMDDIQVAQLFRAIYAYQCDGPDSVGELDHAVKVAFKVFRRKFEKDAAAYEEKCKKARANGSKGGRPRKKDEDAEDDNQTVSGENQKNQTVSGENQTEPKKANYNTNTNPNSNSSSNSNHIYQSHNSGESAGEMDLIDRYEIIIKNNIEYPDLFRLYLQRNENDCAMLDELVNIMWEIMIGKTEEYTINGAAYPAEAVKSRIMKLKKEHIDYVVRTLKQLPNRYNSQRNYKISMLFNSLTSAVSDYINLENSQGYFDYENDWRGCS